MAPRRLHTPATPSTPQAEVTGKWTTGDLHVHTIESDDAQNKLVDVLDQAMITNNLDWTAITNHLRVSTRDQNGTAIVGGPLPFSKAMADYEIGRAPVAGQWQLYHQADLLGVRMGHADA
jgi:hypothetical protein